MIRRNKNTEITFSQELTDRMSDLTVIDQFASHPVKEKKATPYLTTSQVVISFILTFYPSMNERFFLLGFCNEKNIYIQITIEYFIQILFY